MGYSEMSYYIVSWCMQSRWGIHILYIDREERGGCEERWGCEETDLTVCRFKSICTATAVTMNTIYTDATILARVWWALIYILFAQQAPESGYTVTVILILLINTSTIVTVDVFTLIYVYVTEITSPARLTFTPISLNQTQFRYQHSLDINTVGGSGRLVFCVFSPVTVDSINTHRIVTTR